MCKHFTCESNVTTKDTKIQHGYMTQMSKFKRKKTKQSCWREDKLNVRGYQLPDLTPKLSRRMISKTKKQDKHYGEERRYHNFGRGMIEENVRQKSGKVEKKGEKLTLVSNSRNRILQQK